MMNAGSLVAALVSSLGLFAILFRKSALGFLVGSQLFVMGATLVMVSAEPEFGAAPSASVFGILVVLGGVAQLAVGFVLVSRLFALKKRASLDDLKSLKN